MHTAKDELNKWIEEYSTPLLNRAMYLLSNREDAADLVQEVFLAAFAAYHQFEGKSKPLTWLTRILHNKAADFYRKKYKSPATISLEHFFNNSGSWGNNSVLNNWKTEPETAADKAGLAQTLHECLEVLPPKWKIPVKLYYLGEKKAPEVCQETGLTTTNLWKILQRSRLQLRECLETNWFAKK